MRGQHITQEVLQTALEHKRKLERRSEGLYRTRSNWDLYEEILPDTPILPGPFKSISQKVSNTMIKMGDVTAGAEMTMPRSPIMGEYSEKKSPLQIIKESLISTMAKEIVMEKERGKEKSAFLERTIVQSEIDFDKICEEASAQEKESMQWPPSLVYGITPQTSSTEEGLKPYKETPPVLEKYSYRPKVTQSHALVTNIIQGISAFVVPAKRITPNDEYSNKDAVGGRAPLQLTLAFDEEAKNQVSTGILTPARLTKDGNPAVVVQTESWYDTYGTQFFAVDQVNGTIYAIKDNGQ